MKKVLAIAICLMIVAGAYSQALIDENGNIVNATYGNSATEKGNAPYPPAVAYVFPSCYITVASLPDCSFPSRENLGPRHGFLYQTKDQDAILITVQHEATLSSIGINEYIAATTNLWSKELGASMKDLKCSINSDTAIIEVPEAIIMNNKMHFYQKILKTPDGYAGITGFCRARCWSAESEALIRCVNSGRTLTHQEASAYLKHGSILGIDKDNDIFVESFYAKDPKTGELRHTEGRKYIYKPEKSFQTDNDWDSPVKSAFLEESLMRPVPDGLIHKIFDYTIGGQPVNAKNLKRLNDKTYRVKEIRSFKEPFKVCKNVTCRYTAENKALYMITFESNVFVQPNVGRMKERLKEIADAIDKRFHRELKMNPAMSGMAYKAEFKKKVIQQSLTAEIVDDFKATNDGSKKNGKKIKITLIDGFVKETDASYAMP